MPGVVDPNASLQIQRQQVYNALLEQGLSPLAAQNLTQAWVATGNVAGVSRPDLPNGGRPADPFVAAASGNSGLTDTSTDSEVYADYLQQEGYEGEDFLPTGLSNNRSVQLLRGMLEGAGFSVLATGEALIEIAKNPQQFANGIQALINSPAARAQFGEAIISQFQTDLRLLQDAWNSGDWQSTGQQIGKLATDIAGVAGGVAAIARLGVTASAAGGRLLLNAAEDLAFARTVTLAGPQVRPASTLNNIMTATPGVQAAWAPVTQVITEVVPAGTRYYMVVNTRQAERILRNEADFGGWATTNPIPSQAFARNNLAILPEFKADVSFVVQIETTAPQMVNRGFAGPMGSAQGTCSQVEFLGQRSLRIVGQPQPLPGN